MQQYFINTVPCNGTILFDEESKFHVEKVMRMKEGTHIRIVDANKQCFLCEVLFEKGNAYAHVLEELKDSSEMTCEVTLIMGMIREEKWDYVVQKTCELGVKRIVPMTSSRNVVKINNRIDNKITRWNKIAKEACEQCKRFEVAEVTEPVSLNNCAQYFSDVNLIAYENADFKSTDIRDYLHKGMKSLTIIIGPEGGFSDEEVEKLEAQGVKRCSLGKRILRAETAAIYSVCCADVLTEE